MHECFDTFKNIVSLVFHHDFLIPKKRFKLVPNKNALNYTLQWHLYLKIYSIIHPLLYCQLVLWMCPTSSCAIESRPPECSYVCQSKSENSKKIDT